MSYQGTEEADGAEKDKLSEARELPHLGFEGEIWIR